MRVGFVWWYVCVAVPNVVIPSSPRSDDDDEGGGLPLAKLEGGTEAATGYWEPLKRTVLSSSPRAPDTPVLSPHNGKTSDGNFPDFDEEGSALCPSSGRSMAEVVIGEVDQRTALRGESLGTPTYCS